MQFTQDLRHEYRRLFRSLEVRPERKSLVRQVVDSLVAHKGRYERAGSPIGVPWWFVAIIHDLEASRNFHAHLHNGDPLTQRTVHVPAGRPAGDPPFTWEQSATDALTFDGLADVGGWTISRALFRFERFNGFGYRKSTIDIPRRTCGASASTTARASSPPTACSTPTSSASSAARPSC